MSEQVKKSGAGYRLRHSLVGFCLLLAATVMGQVPAPAPAQDKAICITGATAHLGDGRVIENSLIAFEGGRITRVEALRQGEDLSRYQVVEASGRHVYPGFIAANTRLGLEEISSVRATRDFNEVGSFNPNARSLVAYNTDSEIMPTVRSMGILLAQTTPSGGTISGTSSIVQLDAWNWEDAAYAPDNGLHLNWPSLARYQWRTGSVTKNEDYQQQVDEIAAYFAEAKAYSMAVKPDVQNRRFEGMRGLYGGTKRLFIHVEEGKAITHAVQFAKAAGLKPVIVGGRDAWLVMPLLKENDIPVILGQTHSLPARTDEDIDQPFKTPAMLKAAGIRFAISTEAAWQQRNLPFQAGQAAGYGLAKEDAVTAITLDAARILGIEGRTGSLTVGKDANLFVSDGDALDMRTCVVTHAYIQGRSMNLDNRQKWLYRKFQGKYE